MKRFTFLLILSTLLLAGCSANPLVIVTSTGEMPTPLEEVIPADTPTPEPETATPTDTQAPEPTAAATDEPKTAAGTLAYVGTDGNLYLKDLASGAETALTDDATRKLENVEEEVTYLYLQWSSDGELLAYQRQTARKVTTGLDYHFSLWVYDPDADSHREVLPDVQTAGFAWQPGTHTLTFAYSVREGYFTDRALVDSSLATGIMGIDADSGGAPFEIVPPGGGYSLVLPNWSANGRFASFEEILGMEGSGNFATYDMEASRYTSREQGVGGYDLASDGSWLVFDTMTYIPSGMERIWRVNLDWSGAQRISPHYGEGYAFFPRLSPDDSQVAYLKGTGMPGEPGGDLYELFVQPTVETPEPLFLGVVNTPITLDWMPDGKSLLLTVNATTEATIITIRLEDAFVNKLADGSYPAIRP